jgi:type VI secretion system protein ImpF
MAQARNPDVLRPSVVDRLLAPAGKGGSPAGVGFRELRAAVARDLEWLLNTKSVLSPYPAIERLEQARDSVFTYGIPDFSTASWRSPNDARRICAEIEGAVKTFEPRLIRETVRVVVLPNQGADEFRLKFRIEGTLHVEPITQPVYFDSTVEVDTGTISVETTQ